MNAQLFATLGVFGALVLIGPVVPRVQGQHMAAKMNRASQALFEAIRRNDLTATRTLARRSDLNIGSIASESRNKEGRTPLMVATALDRGAIVHAILGPTLIRQVGTWTEWSEYNIGDINETDRGGMTALMLAAQHGAQHSAKAILDWIVPKLADGLDCTPIIDFRSPSGRTALDIARSTGHRRVAELIEQALRQNYDLLLLAAATDGQPDVAEKALGRGASVDARDLDGLTPLMQAAKWGRKNLVTLLLGKGADVNALDHKAYTALTYAVEDGHVEIARQLLGAGADVDIRDFWGLARMSTPAISRGWR